MRFHVLVTIDADTIDQATAIINQQLPNVETRLITPDAVGELLDLADPLTRDTLMRRIRNEKELAANRELIDLVRRTAAEPRLDADGVDTTAPVAVFFGPSEYENGYFLDPTGTAVFADGFRETFDFATDDDQRANELMNLNGACGGSAVLIVNLRTGTVDFDDYGNNLLDDLFTSLGITPDQP